jgi:hypothetical protein
MNMHIGVLKEGDEVLSVSKEFIAVRRKSHEVDLIPLVDDPKFGLRIETGKIVTIGFGENEVSVETENGDLVTNF